MTATHLRAKAFSLCLSRIGPPLWGVPDAEIKFASGQKPQLSTVLFLKSEVGRKIDFCVWPTAGIFILSNSCLSSSFNISSSPFFSLLLLLQLFMFLCCCFVCVFKSSASIQKVTTCRITVGGKCWKESWLPAVWKKKELKTHKSLKRTLFSWTIQDKKSEFSRKSSFPKLRTT